MVNKWYLLPPGLLISYIPFKILNPLGPIYIMHHSKIYLINFNAIHYVY